MRRGGFTLVEVLLALLIVSIGVLSTTGLLNSALDAAARARGDLRAVGFADLVFGQLHATADWRAIPTSGTLETPNHDGTTARIAIGGIHPFVPRSIGRDGTTRARPALTYSLAIRSANRVKIATLLVWPDHATRGPPRVFQTEIYDWSHARAPDTE